MLRLIWNYCVKNNLIDGELLNEKAKFNVKLQDANAFESLDDKIKRRKAELEWGIKDEIDFYMEDNECSEEYAIQQVKIRVKRRMENHPELQQQQGYKSVAQRAKERQ
jgi:hypothetical protein